MSEKTSIDSIFCIAVEIESTENREAYLDGICGDDPQLRQRVNRLLSAHFQGGSILDSPAHGLGVTVDQSIAEQPGDTLGRYKLLQQIGEGGFGVVYMAEQVEPVRRKIALKVIKPGMDTKEVIARFESERQALALMDHPNIAKVFDAGTTDSGRPYFVMELVKGIPLVQFCDENKLATQQRLGLFVTVCRAIQHAHHKGVIHRDLKPSNVMVTLHDNKPVPKVIDFGVSKALSQQLTEKTLFTAFGQMIGTPIYMSPEQAQMSGLDIDTRSDIYSLGVILYELLTGATPLDAERLRNSGYAEMQRIIREEEAPRPSLRLSTTAGEARAKIAKNRATNPKQLNHELRGDLDWIVMKSLEKERNRRYDTANSFADDVERFLTNDVVQACPPSVGYRLRKFASRNKVVFTTASVIVMIVLIGIATTTWQAIAATRARNQAVAERAKAVEAQGIANNALKLEESARKDADNQRQLVEQRAETIRRNLYFAKMILAGQSSAEPSGIVDVRQLLQDWKSNRSDADLRGWEWFFLESLCHKDRLTFSGHTIGVTSVVWSPDGSRVASSDGGLQLWNANVHPGAVKIWDAVTGEEWRTLRGHSDVVSVVAWSTNSLRLATSSLDGTVKIWDAITGKQLLELSAGKPRERSSEVHTLYWSPDGAQLASAAIGGTIKNWDATTGQHLRSVRTDRWNYAASWSPDGTRLASAGLDIKILDVPTGKVIQSLGEAGLRVTSVCWSPDGTHLASAGWDHKVNIWDVTTGELAHTLSGHLTYVFSVSWSPDGTRLASASLDNTVKIWDTTSGSELQILRGHVDSVQSVSWSPDSDRLASASEDKTVKIWDVTTTMDTSILRGHEKSVMYACWSPDAASLASAGMDHTVRVWDTVTAEERLRLHGHTDVVTGVSWSPSGKRLVSASRDGTVKVWDALSGEVIHALRGPANRGVNYRNIVWDVFWSPDGTRLAASTSDGKVEIWDAVSGKLDRTLTGHQAHVYEVRWSHDSQRLASASADRTVKIWDAANGRELQTLRGHVGGVLSVSWNPEGTRLASGGTDKTVKVWDTENGKILFAIPAHTGHVGSVSWSPDGSRLASSSSDSTVKVWDSASGTLALRLTEHDGAASVAWSADGKRLASGSVDGTIKFWDATPGYESERLKTNR